VKSLGSWFIKKQAEILL